MELNRMGVTPIVIFNFIIALFFTFAYFYQFIYLFVAWVKGSVKIKDAQTNHKYAFVIAAHNEESVIAQLVASIKAQDYPSELIETFVIADACTDNTAQCARNAGAIVWERNDLARKGKSWVLDYAFDRILNEYGDEFEAFFVFDADNLLSPTYVAEMNKVFDAGYMVSTSYRNSKNFDSSWVSSAYATWFVREAKFLNNARMLCGTSCAISGSGWMVSRSVIRGMHGWDFHTLTEDIQFSTFCAANGIQIGYSPAEFYDEQPITFAASWTQRMRWTKGFYQVFFSYVGDLFHGMKKSRKPFAAYDMLMTIAPGNFLTLASVFVNALYLIIGSMSRGYLATNTELSMCFGSLVMTFVTMYVTFFVLAVITTISEYKHFRFTKPNERWRIITNLFTFPFFMLTYIPINVAALFMKVEWVPTKHTVSLTADDMVKD